MGERAWMIEKREAMQLSRKAMGLKCKCSETLLCILEEDESSVTNPHIALRVADAYGIDDPYQFMNPKWRGKKILPVVPDERLLASIAGLEPPKAAPPKRVRVIQMPIYNTKNSEVVDINGPAIALLLLARGVPYQGIALGMKHHGADWLRDALRRRRRMKLGDVNVLAELLKVPANVLLADCPESILRKHLPKSYFEADAQTREALVSRSTLTMCLINKDAFRQKLADMGLTTFKDLSAMSESVGLARPFLYSFLWSHHERATLADAARMMQAADMTPEEFFAKEEDARVFTCASGALSAPTDRRRVRS